MRPLGNSCKSSVQWEQRLDCIPPAFSVPGRTAIGGGGASDSAWGCRWSRFSFPLTRTLPSQLRRSEPCSDGVSPREGTAPRLLWHGLRGICDGSRIRDTVSGTRCSVREEERRRGRACPVLEFPGDVVAPGHCPVGRHGSVGTSGKNEPRVPPTPGCRDTCLRHDG